MIAQRTVEAAEPTTHKAPRRREVEHFHWVSDIAFSAATGIAIPTLCGAKWEPVDDASGLIEMVGGIMVLLEPTDCKHCVRVLETKSRGKR